MMNLAEYRRTAARLADYLPWAALVGAGVVLNKDGSFQRSARFRGPDLDSAVPAELIAFAARLNNAFRRLGSGWAIFVEAQRHPAGRYPSSLFTVAAAALVDAERKADFEEAGRHFETSYYLTFAFLPPADDAARTESWLYEGREQTDVDPHDILRSFIDRTDRVLQLLEGTMPECRWLDDGETLTYLHACISTKRHRVRVPETPMYLDALLADEPLTGGLAPILGKAHLRILTVVGFPSATSPGILDELNQLAFPYRWSTRAILLDKTDATRLLTKIRRQWFAKRKSIAAILKEVLTNEASVLVDSDADNKAVDADLPLQELGADFAGIAFVTATVTVWDEDPRAADEKLRAVDKVLQGRNFTAITETVNAVDAWLGTLPGHLYGNVRQPPVSTLNLAHMIPLSAVWAGPERDEHFGAPPLLFGKAGGSTPFRFSLHVGDVGHTLVVGPTGSGKSVLLALMALQFRRYVRSQVFAFDFGGSIRAAALAMRGNWHDLGGRLTDGSTTSVSLQPLARIEDVPERAWTADWVVSILTRENIEITPDVKEHLWSALTSLASAPVHERTLTGLSVLLQSNPLKQALRPYCVGGPYGRLLDAESEELGAAAVQVYETEGLLETGAAAPVLAYLFHRITDRLDGRPTLILVDEGWLALSEPGFSRQLTEWLVTLRKKNASVIFAYLISNWNSLARIIFESFAGLGLKASGTGFSTADLLRPGKVAQTGLDAARPLLESISDLMGWISFFENFIQIACMLLAWALVLLAFFILAVQLFVTLIEFKLSTLAGFVLIPFGLFGKSAFMAERVLGNVISSGIKVLVLAVIIGIGSTLFSEFTAGFGGATPTIDQAMAIVLAALSLLGLGVFGPGIANGLVSGGPQLSAGAAVGTGLAAGGALMAAGAAGGMALGGGMAALSGTAAAARGGAALAGGASTAYSLASAGQSGASGVASGLGGVASAGAEAAVSPLKRAVSRGSAALRTSQAAGARAALEATGGTSTMGTVAGGMEAAGGSSSAARGARSDGPPAWARRMKRAQNMTHGIQTAAHAVRSGDGHGGGHSVTLSGNE